MIAPVHRSLGRKLMLAIGLPSLLFAVVMLLWLRSKTQAIAPEIDAAYRLAILAVILFAAGMGAIHALAMRFLVEHPLQRLAAGLRRARDGDFLYRVPVETTDELGALAENFNTTLAAITDLHARRIDDAASMESMQRELALKAQLEARLKELTLLFDLSRRLVSTLELDQLLESVTELVGRGLGDHAFALFLAEEGTGDLVVRTVSGLDAAVVGARVRSGDGPAGWAARERATVLVDDTATDPRRPVLPWQPDAWAEGSILSVPLLHQSGCGGVLAFFRPGRHAFPADEVRLLESVAGQAAIAIENARLHQKMVRLSQTDALTGVHNRRSLFARLQLEADRCERFDHPMAVALVDVDRFRAYNDAHGHAAGDADPPEGRRDPAGCGPEGGPRGAVRRRGVRGAAPARGPGGGARRGREAAGRGERGGDPARRRPGDDLGRRGRLAGRRAGSRDADGRRRRGALRGEAGRA